MANSFTVKVLSVATDGTNLFLEIQIFNGSSTSPIIRPTFPVGTSAGEINTYLQTIANNQPALTADIGALVNSTVLGA